MSQDNADASADPTPAPGLGEADRALTIPPGIPMARPISVSPLARSFDPLWLMSESRPRAWADIGIVLLVMISLEVMIGTLIGAATGIEGIDKVATGRLEESLISDVLIPMLSLRAIVACLTIFVVARHRRQTRDSVGLRSTNALLDIGLGWTTPPIVYGLGYMTIVLISLFQPGTFGQMQENAERLKEILPPLPFWGYSALAVLIGVYEELLFRGFLMPRLRRATGSWVLAVLLSTGLFTLLHAGDQTAPALIMVAVLSLAFSLLTIWRRSIIPAIIAHTLFDLAQFLLLRYVFPGATS